MLFLPLTLPTHSDVMAFEVPPVIQEWTASSAVPVLPMRGAPETAAREAVPPPSKTVSMAYAAVRATSGVIAWVQVLFGGVGGLEAEFARNFGTGRGCAGAGNGTLDQVQNLLLAGGELGRIEHVGSSTVLISSICIFEQFWKERK